MSSLALNNAIFASYLKSYISKPFQTQKNNELILHCYNFKRLKLTLVFPIYSSDCSLQQRELSLLDPAGCCYSDQALVDDRIGS